MRDVVLLALGTVVVLTELAAWMIFGRTPDPSLLVFATGALGLPIFIRKDER